MSGTADGIRAGGIPPKPADSTWTDEQWQAIHARGSDLLVAAAAGSGKTAVLVERIIRTAADESAGVDIDRLLVVTFTNAAAAEMRHRLRNRLEQSLASRPGSRHLRRQLALVGRASITTLHSFCLEVVRRFVHLTGLDPAFRIANETEAALLRQEALEEVFERRYAEGAEDGPFWRLADGFGGERGDDGLMKLVDRLYEYARSHPFPESWLQEAAAAFRLEGEELPEDHPWLQSLKGDVKLELEAACAALRTAAELAESPGGPAAYADNLNADAAYAQRLLSALLSGGWRELRREALEAGPGDAFGRLKAQRGGDTDPALTERVKKLRAAGKERIDALVERLLARELSEYAADVCGLAPMMDELVRLVLDFGDAYGRAKAERGLADFGDLEHACLAVLLDASSGPGRLVPSEAALAYREQFLEVYVDEYQDTNAVQETILTLVSGGAEAEPGTESAARKARGNRFMVGDVKQSIYRFRLAEPGLFLHKYKTFRPLDGAASAADAGGAPAGAAEAAPSAGTRIDLARNFRSRQEVVDAVNFIFRQIMHEEAAELDYDERAELVRGASYPEADEHHPPVPEVLLLDRSGAAAADSAGGEKDAERDGEPEELDAAETEARAIGMRILEWTGRAGKPPMRVYDKDAGGMRPIAFRDIVILLRADKSWSPAFIEQLRLLGIPAHAELAGGYFDSLEVDAVLALLRTIDNPLQDIPLAATMRSPMFGFTDEELARIRVFGGTGVSFYEAVGAVASGSAEGAPEALREKAGQFLSRLEPWRTAARQGTLAELILRLYRETGYFDYVGGLHDGAQRQANLRALYDRARQYEATSFRGLFRFLRFIDRMRDSGADLAPARALGEAEDVVRIMSIHKSKGLEFPVCIVAGLGKKFNRLDEKEPFLLHKELGFGPRFVDPGQGFAYPTLPQLAIRGKLRAEALAEEMRVLYVALTRAKEKLVLVGTAGDLAAKLAGWAEDAAEPAPRLAAHALRRADCYLDWIVPALLRHPSAAELRKRFGLAQPPLAIRDGSLWEIYAAAADDLREAAVSRERTSEWAEHAVRDGLPVPDDWTSRDGEVERALGWRYPQPAASVLYAKTTVTEWKRRLADEAEAEYPADAPAAAPAHREPLRRPRFAARRGLTAAERGVAYHTVMQHLPARADLTADEVAELLSDLTLRELLTEEQRAAVDAEAVAAFAASEPGRRLAGAARQFRELPFTVGLPAAQVYGAAEGGEALDEDTARETVLVQGVIDCLFEDEKGFAIVDYKTDDTAGGRRLEELVRRYRTQLSVYALAAEKALGRDVPDRYLYFFDGARTVKL